MLKKNESIPLEIVALNHEGAGVGRHEGMAVFVPMTAVGDRIDARVVKVMKSYAFAIVERLGEPSAAREENRCPVYDRCGGCALRHLAYGEELKIKGGWVTDNLRRIGGIVVEPEAILPSPAVDHYRNKAQYPVRMVDGRVRAGFFARRSHRLVPAEDCLLQPAFFGEIVRCVTAFMEEAGIPPYDEENHTGLVRHIFIRHGEATGQTMVWLSLNGEDLPRQVELAERLRAVCPGLASFGIDVNKKRTNVIFGGRLKTLWGGDTIADVLCGVTLRLSPLAFYQVNRGAAEALFRAALAYADPAPGDLLLDLYCGAGAVGLSMARRVREIVGVEVIPQAVENAKQNAQENGIKNARFLCADAGGAVERFREEGLRPDIIVLDPPRKGADSGVIGCIGALAPGKVVYISCNSATLARDCKLLAELGYRVAKVRAADLFPRTANVEAVALLLRVGERETDGKREADGESICGGVSGGKTSE